MCCFMCWCQIIDWLNFEILPSSLRNLGMAYSIHKFALHSDESLKLKLCYINSLGSLIAHGDNAFLW